MADKTVKIKVIGVGCSTITHLLHRVLKESGIEIEVVDEFDTLKGSVIKDNLKYMREKGFKIMIESSEPGQRHR